MKAARSVTRSTSRELRAAAVLRAVEGLACSSLGKRICVNNFLVRVLAVFGALLRTVHLTSAIDENYVIQFTYTQSARGINEAKNE
jgi:hypothetical protein